MKKTTVLFICLFFTVVSVQAGEKASQIIKETEKRLQVFEEKQIGFKGDILKIEKEMKKLLDKKPRDYQAISALGKKKQAVLLEVIQVRMLQSEALTALFAQAVGENRSDFDDDQLDKVQLLQDKYSGGITPEKVQILADDGANAGMCSSDRVKSGKDDDQKIKMLSDDIKKVGKSIKADGA